jgi:hypothetical protein
MVMYNSDGRAQLQRTARHAREAAKVNHAAPDRENSSEGRALSEHRLTSAVGDSRLVQGGQDIGAVSTSNIACHHLSAM